MTDNERELLLSVAAVIGGPGELLRIAERVRREHRATSPEAAGTEPIYPPCAQELVGKPWFREVLDGAEKAASILSAHDVRRGEVALGFGWYLVHRP